MPLQTALTLSRVGWELGRDLGVGVAAGLREVALGHDAQAQRQRLQEHGQHVGQQHDHQQRVPKLGAALQVRCPVPWVLQARRTAMSVDRALALIAVIPLGCLPHQVGLHWDTASGHCIWGRQQEAAQHKEELMTKQELTRRRAACPTRELSGREQHCRKQVCPGARHVANADHAAHAGEGRQLRKPGPRGRWHRNAAVDFRQGAHAVIGAPPFEQLHIIRSSFTGSR